MVESELYPLLQNGGFHTPNYCRFALHDDPIIDFYPVALKIESEKIVHKSDVGGVALSLCDANALQHAREKIIAGIASYGISLDAERDGFIAAEMVRGEELFAGVVDDPIFGKTILFGKGGVLLELYRDVCYIDIDADEREIERSLRTTKIAGLFDGYRGSRLTIKTAIDFIRKMQTFLSDNPQIQECDFNPVILNDDGFTVVDARLKYRDKAPIPPRPRRLRHDFFTNASVAVIGASLDPSKVGYAIARNALSYNGRLYLVNTKGGEFEGKELYRSIDDIDDIIDTAVITIPASLVIETVQQLIPKGVKNIIIVSAGFKEVGDTQSEQYLFELAVQHNLNIIGPNCLGYYEATRSLNLTFGSSDVRTGSLALIAQSGAVLSSLMDKAAQQRIGFSHILSAGNMADLDFADIISMLNDAPECKAISIYAEGISEGKEVLRAIRNCTKPIRVYKAGKSPQARKAAFSHTGNLSGDYPMFKGLLESAGVKMVDTIESLLHQSSSYKDIAIITNAGGPGTILTDYVIERGSTLATLSERSIADLDKLLPSNWSRNNPIDIIGDAQSPRFEAALKYVDTLEEVGMIYLLVTPQMMTDTFEIAKLLERPWKKKVHLILLGGVMMHEAAHYLYERRLPYFTSLQEASAFL